MEKPEKKGWISLHRKLLDNPISKKTIYLSIWIYILLRTSRYVTEFIFNNKKQTLPAGSFITSIKKIAEHFTLSKSVVSYVLDYLKLERMIERTSHNRYTVITVLNFTQYQELERQIERKKNDNRTEIERQQKQSIIIDKENKENKTSKNSLTPCTEEELKNLSTKLNVSLEAVKRTHAIILNKIEAKEFKGKTVYHSLDNWIRMGIERGNIKINIEASYKLAKKI